MLGDALPRSWGVLIAARVLWRARALAAAFVLASCARYHPRPLPPVDAVGRPAPPDWPAVRIAASEISHPMLPAIVVNVDDGITPDEAALLAIAANPTLRVARAARGVAVAQVVAAGLLPNPQVSGSIDRPRPDSSSAVTATSLGVAVDLLGFLTRGSEVDAARRGLQSVDLGIAWQEWQVAQAVRTRTYLVMLADRALALAREQERDMATTVSTLQAAVDRQLATRVELGAAEIAYRSAVASRLTLALERDTALVSLAQLLGVDRASLPHIQQSAVPFDQDSVRRAPGVVPTLDALMHDLGSRRLDLQGLRFGYQSQEARVRAAVLRQFPPITIGVNRARDTGNLLTMGSAVTMLFPFFNRNQGEIALARATRGQLEAEYLARTTEARASVEALLVEVNTAVERLRNLRATAAAQQETVELYGRALQSGNADVLTYYRARTDLNALRLEAVAALGDLVALAIALETEAGIHFVVP